MRYERQQRVRSRVVMRWSTGSGALPRSGCTADLSAGGLFLNSRAVLPVGTHVLGRLELPGGARAEVHAIVVWNRPAPRALNEPTRGGMGLRLLWADGEYFAHLAATSPAG